MVTFSVRQLRTQLQTTQLQKMGWLLSLVCLQAALLGCTPASNSNPPLSSESSPADQTAAASTIPGQALPFTAQIQVAGQQILLEVAKTPKQQEIGLMNRTSLAPDRGMVFVFEPARPTQFWMKNTLIPLDMIFVRQGVIKYIANSAPPCTSNPCPTYGSLFDEIDQVIELRGGRATELKLKVGDRLVVQPFTATAPAKQ